MSSVRHAIRRGVSTTSTAIGQGSNLVHDGKGGRSSYLLPPQFGRHLGWLQNATCGWAGVGVQWWNIWATLDICKN